MAMLTLRISRCDQDDMAHVFDLGDLAFVFDDGILSTQAQARYATMVYLSLDGLVYCLSKLRRGAKRCTFLAADSSFVVLFEQEKQRIYLSGQGKRYGPFVLDEVLAAVDAGIDHFIADPRNALDPDGAMHGDFHASRLELKDMLAAKRASTGAG
ncbi:hypothetical protein INH39_18335 [Massilia violaceinigra]|uniref:Uncharacterized protein n=1 Tax=Massilia violaceinigra TaxID=2045208 RepID=A0ABY4A191_9BURK|nr:hypothetical protein [Massilia violaceinigra]UOD27479.1 hypothetical protein INH39_18335 [Massilia violaceinigra]